MQAGDHLYVHKSLFGTGGRHYSHHGLYIGNRRVIHYAGYANGFSAGGSQRVEMVSLEAFSTGQPVRICTHAERPFDHAEAVRRALSRLGEDKYNLLWRNCEHFATWCCTGEERSEQVRKATIRLGLATGRILLETPAGHTAAELTCKAAGRIGQAALKNPYVAISVAALAVVGGGYWALRKRLT